MAKLGNRVKETTDTTGTGTVDLNGAATGFRGFADEFVSTDSVYYLIVDDPDSPTEYEYGTGTFTTGTPNTLSRDAVEGSSNAGSKVSFSAGTKTVVNTALASAILTPTGDGSNLTGVLLQGTFSIFVPASAMLARASNGASYGTLETSTNANLYDYMAFDTTTQEYAGFSLTMPKGWNEGTVTAALVWSHPAATAYTIDFDLAAVAVGDGDALDAAHGTPVSITDTGGTTDDVYRSANSSALTIAGTPAAEDTVSFELTRDVASDTLDVDARIHGVVINITYGANDA